MDKVLLLYEYYPQLIHYIKHFILKDEYFTYTTRGYDLED